MRDKELFLPKTRIKDERLKRYRRAYAAWKREKDMPDLSFSAFIRDCLDVRSAELLGKR